ncbi:putative F-box protein At2g02030 [Papaver somniferum]|uniref:putative F-box protein At2g02030 n=1 Tax=Papaver somniferum TaxID=3469 RepID=UPI000E6FF2FE|nr:putative F-box protein At2g02030 [Papaver somniferum]
MKQCIMIPKENRKILKVALGDHELTVCEILSRLPAKSLVRFKCVCKNWESLIQKDQLFSDLHFNRSQTHSCSGTTSLLIWVSSLWDRTERNERCLLSAELLLPYDSSGEGGGASVQRKIPLNIGVNPVSGVSMLNIVNGLVCLIDGDSHSTCVFNPSTRESTPWIKSMVIQKQEEQGGILKRDNKFSNYYWNKFGYDVATRDYKVVSLWSRIVGPTKTNWVCEIFSLRDKSWRLIDAVPSVLPFYLLRSVYANGSIYWFRADGTPLIVELNFVTEKFREISVPSPVITGFCNQYKTALVEVDGRLALFTKDVRPSYNYILRKKEHEDDVKMYVLYDDQDSTKNSTATCSTNYHWMPVSFAKPPFDWKQDMFPRDDFIIPIPGTDIFIVRPDDDFSFYYYNWKKKSYSRKFELNGTKSFFNKKSNNGERDHISFSTFTENLMPLN